jgi:hypothetical protein
VERPDVGETVGDGRVERLGGGDRGLDRGQAEDPLRGGGQPDLGGVADRPRAWGWRVDDEPDVARGDEVEDRDLVDQGVAFGMNADVEWTPRPDEMIWGFEMERS